MIRVLCSVLPWLFQRAADDIYPGNLSMPHGYGLLWENEQTGTLGPVGTHVQALVSFRHRDPHTGIPLRKDIPAAVKKVRA